MALTITQEKEIALLDGTVIKVRPLKISLLKKFMETFDEISEVAEDNNKSMTVLMNCVVLAMQQFEPELAELEKLEEVLDLPTVYAIINEASGIDLTGSAVIGGNV
jgi:nitrate reductase NapAB chaperone NapD